MEDITLESARTLESYMPLGPGCSAAAIRAANHWLSGAECGAFRLLDGVREVLERIVQQRG